MHLRINIFCGVLLLVAVSAALDDATTTKPNFVILFVDDMGIDRECCPPLRGLSRA